MMVMYSFSLLSPDLVVCLSASSAVLERFGSSLLNSLSCLLEIESALRFADVSVVPDVLGL
jgi:hypothetical protein